MLAAADRCGAMWWSVHWPLMGGLLYLVQWRAPCDPARSSPRSVKK